LKSQSTRRQCSGDVIYGHYKTLFIFQGIFSISRLDPLLLWPDHSPELPGAIHELLLLFQQVYRDLLYEKLELALRILA